jgi:hypothetical protein
MSTGSRAESSSSLGDGSSYGSSILPSPFEQPYLLYTMHVIFSFVSRMWEMGIVLLIAQITHNSLFFVALAGLLGSLVVFLFMSSIGDWLDRTDRLYAVRFAIIVKIITVSAAYFLCATLAKTEGHIVAYALPVLCAMAGLAFQTITQSVEKDWIVVLSDGDTQWLSATNSVMTQIDMFSATAAPAVTGFMFSAFHHSTTACLLLILNAVVSFGLWMYAHFLYGSWPPLGSRHPAYDRRLKRRTDMQYSSSADAHVSLTQMTGAGAAPAVSNPLFQGNSQAAKDASASVPSKTAEIDLKIAALSKTLGESYESDRDEEAQANLDAGHTHKADSFKKDATTFPQSADKRQSQQQEQEADEEERGGMRAGVGGNGSAPMHPYLECIPGARTAVDFARQLSSGWSAFYSSGCAGTMLAFAFLFFTVLSFGPLMTVYLRWAGMSDYWIGISRGVNAIFGFIGATLFPYLKAKWGIWLVAQRAIWYQFTLVFFAASSFYWGTQTQSNFCLVVGVLFSRVGLWLFDLCARQIAQEAIPENLRGATNGFWASITALFNMATFVVAIMYPNPEDFILLTSISATVIFCAATTFTLSQPKFFDEETSESNDSVLDIPARILRRLCGTFRSGSDGKKDLGQDRAQRFETLSQNSTHDVDGRD